MKYNNEPTILDIPSLSNEWILKAILNYNKSENYFRISDISNISNDVVLCQMTIFHTIVGDINIFNVVCRNDINTNYVFEAILEPILTAYCTQNKIELKMEYL